MVILHICWSDGRLCVWGEQEAGAARLRADDVSAQPQASPFDPGELTLRGALAKTLFGIEPADAPARQLLLALPTRHLKEGAVPVPSYPFLLSQRADGEQAKGPVALHTWRVSALECPWKTAFSLFGQCKERRLAAEVFAAEDLLGFSELFRYAGALVARGRFLPACIKNEACEYEALWRPSIDREENRRLTLLAERLPASACCGQPAGAVTEAFLDETIDRLVRVSVVTTLSRAQAERGKHYSVHDAWFSALRGEARAIRWDECDELDALCQQLDVWRRPVEGGRERDEQASLCLQEPASPEEPWFLNVSFEAAADRYPTENMLLSLGQAAMLFPPLGNAERRPEGLGCLLNAAEAHAFLTASSPLLVAAGFTVSLPSWWPQDATHALTLEADASPRAGSVDQPESLSEERVDIHWTVTLNGEPVTPKELESLLQPQMPLVFFRGRWIQVDLRQIQNALRVEKRKTDKTHSALEVVRLALGTGVGQYGLDVSAVRGSGWLDPFLKRLRGEQTFETLSAPSAFHGELRPYQLRGYSWLVYLRRWGFGACLADDMGLGKTIQALAFLLDEKERGERRPVLLVGPMSVLGNWMKEAQRFAPGLKCLLHHGTQRWHGDSFAQEAQAVDLVITSYHLLYRDYASLRKVGWAGVLLDEAQNIKNPDTQQAQAARALQADYRLALTGTPMENHVGDVWSIMDFLNPGMLGKREVFREKFYRPIQSGTDPGARSRLRRVTTPFILRRLKTDKQIIADLPDKVESKVYCPLTMEQAKLYEEELEAFQRELSQTEGMARRGLILAVLTRLKQICNHPAHYLGQAHSLSRRSGKLVRLEEMLEEVFERGESALVFTQYAEMGKLLKRQLCHTFGREMPFLHGGVPRKDRDRMVQDFQESTSPLAFVLSLKAGGTGLNLTRATHVFHYDRWWNPAVENQATDRAYRIGQTRDVMVHKFICGGTLEDRIDAMIESKTALADEIVTSGETFLTELSNEGLRDFLQLSDAAIADDAEMVSP
jgi:superfamily II DNA or RNA helicase